MSLKQLSELASLGALVNNPDSKRLQTVSIDDVVSKEQPRKHFADIDILAESLKENGLLQPITVSPRNAEGKYVIQMGERRFRAAKLAGFTEIKVLIGDEYESREQGLVREIVENIQRQDLEPLEIAEALRQLAEDHGLTIREIAKKLAVNKTYVGNHMRLLKIHPELRQLMMEGIVRDVETINSLDIAFHEIPERVEEFVKRIRQDGITRAQARELASVVRKKKKEDNSPSVSDNSETESEAGSTPQSSSADDGQSLARATPSTDIAQAETANERVETASNQVEDYQQDGPPDREDNTEPSDTELTAAVTASGRTEPKAPKKKSPKPANQYVEMVSGGNKSYVVVPPNEAVVQVMVRLDDDQEYDATLLFDHVDMRNGYVWVLLEGDEQPISIKAEMVRLKEVRAIDDGEN